MKKIISVFILFILGAKVTHAISIHIPLHEIIQSSKLILIGTSQGEDPTTAGLENVGFDLTVESVLKGQCTEDKIRIHTLFSSVNIAKGERIVAFFDSYSLLDCVGISDDFEKGLIQIEHFSNYGSNWVYPASLTLPQLKTYLATGSYSGTVSGGLEIFSTELREWKKFPIQFDLAFTYTDGMNTTLKTSGVEITAFSSNPTSAYWGNGAAVVYIGDYYNDYNRPLKFKSAIDSVDSTGTHFTTSFRIESPGNITAEEFEKYIADPTMGHIYYELEIKMESTSYTIMYYEKPNEGIYLITPDNQRFDYTSAGFPRNDARGNMNFGRSDVQYELDFDQFELYKETWDMNSFQCLSLEPRNGELFIIKDGEKTSLGKCVLSIKKKSFAKI